MAIEDASLGGTGEAIGSVLGGGFANILSYAWVLFPIGIIILILGLWWVFRMFKKKNSQWTHTLEVKRVGQDGRILEGVSTHRMRRFPLIKRADVFELELPLLGSYLFPELDEYSGLNKFKIVIDKDNRIYTNKGEYFVKDKGSINVSAKHSEIDLTRATLKEKFQNIHAVNKRVEWAQIAKYAFLTIFVVIMFILAIQGISAWGDAQDVKAAEAQAEAQAFQSLADAMVTIESTVNTQQLIILPMLREIYGTNNLQGIISDPPIVIGGSNETQG